ncbi:MAG: hypothetical protein ACU85U_19710, partial [Gammaproteobacteria bacterium]
AAIDLLEDQANGPVLANVSGSAFEHAHGLSIYMPDQGCSPFYGDLAFAKSGWDAFIYQLNGIAEPKQGRAVCIMHTTRSIRGETPCPLARGTARTFWGKVRISRVF